MSLRWTCLLILLPWFQSTAIGQDKAPEELQGFQVEAIGLVGEEISGVVLDRETIRQSGLDHVNDLTARAPGLFIASGGSSAFGDVQTLRGIGNTPLFSSPGIIFYIDGVPAGDSSSLPLFLEGIDSISILRGPQGHLFGRNAPGGVVDIRTQRAGEKAETRASVSYGELESRKFQILSSGPLKGSWSYNLTATQSARDGYIQDLNFGRAKNDYDYAGGRLSVFGKWKGLEVQAGASLERIDEGSQGLVPYSGPNPLQSDTNEEEQSTNHRNSQWLVTSKKFDWGTLTSTTSRTEWKLGPYRQDLDMTSDLSPSEIAYALLDQNQEIMAKGLELKSNQDQEKPFDWKMGLFYQDSETIGLSHRSFLRLDETAAFTLEEESLAAYASGTYRHGASMDLTMGLRLDRTEKGLSREKSSAFAGMDLPPATPINLRERWSKALPHLGATWHIDKHLDLFARSTLGYKPGGFSAYGDNIDNPVRFKEEINRSLEAGLSWRSSSGALSAVFTGFQNRIENFQFEKSAGRGTDYVVVNADKARVQGMELELMAFLSKTLMLTGSYSRASATFEDHHGYKVIIVPEATDFTGNRLPFTPRHTLNLAAQYQEDDGTFARMEWRRIGDTFFDEANVYRQPAYDLLNARLGRTFGEYSIQIFAQNLTDERYFSLIVPLGGPLVAAATGSPRVIGIEIQRRF